LARIRLGGVDSDAGCIIGREGGQGGKKNTGGRDVYLEPVKTE